MQNGAHAGLQLCILAACLTGCVPASRITEEDVSLTLKATMQLAAKSQKVPANACVDTRLGASSVKIPGRTGEWTRFEGSRFTYRLLHASKIERLPPEAIFAIPEKMRASSCRHRLVFHQPEFLEINESGRKSTVAFVAFSDLCPECGAGYQVMLTKSGRHWKADPPDVGLTWIS